MVTLKKLMRIGKKDRASTVVLLELNFNPDTTDVIEGHKLL